MYSTPVNSKSFALNAGLGLKLTPSNSPSPRTPRSPNKTRTLFDTELKLSRIIGTTVSSPTAFDCISSPPIFAYTAGATAVVVNIDNNSTYSQTFFRARPTAAPLNILGGSTYAPSTPINTSNDGKSRASNLWKDGTAQHSPLVSSTNFEWGDSPSSKTWTSRERIKAATCLSISRDGKLLAVGETGYSPRVLIFPILESSSDAPLMILNEHTFGVRAVAFSSDQRYLASLGTPNDGFLYVWSINQRNGAAKLHSSNKCTSSIKQMIWLGNNIVTVGVRHIKMWKLEETRSTSPTKQRSAVDGTSQPMAVSPITKALAGRNIVLGPLVEATFTAIVAIPNQKAIVASEKGDLCMLYENQGQRLMKITNTGFPITCLTINTDETKLHIAGKNGELKSMHLEEIDSLSLSTSTQIGDGEQFTQYSSPICAMAYSGDTLVTIGSDHSIRVLGPALEPKAPFTAHSDAVLGVRLLSEENKIDAVFLTWSANGTIIFWDIEGRSKLTQKLEIEQNLTLEEEARNQCQAICVSRMATYLLAGDRYGILRIIDPSTGTSKFETRAHLSEIQDISLYEGQEYTVAGTCGRDRTVQLFRLVSDDWTLIQTIDDHSASVSSVLFAEHGKKLISCSTDRTIHIRHLVRITDSRDDTIGAIPLRIITLKASPVSISLCSDDQLNSLMVSLLDRTVATYDTGSGRLISTFRATDNEGVDAVVLDALVMGNQSSSSSQPTILAGISGTDKSVRVYDGNTGLFLDREWGHTASVTGVALIESSGSDQKTLVSTASDGTIMIWNLSTRIPGLQEPLELSSNYGEESPPKETMAARPPLRRVLSKAELAEFQRASPVLTPTGRGSPPRAVRRKTSRYGALNQPTMLSMPAASSKHVSSASEETLSRRSSPRNRSRSPGPPTSPRAREIRRPSLAFSDSRGRTKSSNNLNEFGSLNMATEQACRMLRSYRKKLMSSEAVKGEALNELDQELRLTTIALGEKSLKSQAVSETVITGLLDQYSERLVSMFDEKLRLTKLKSTDVTGSMERPKSAGAG